MGRNRLVVLADGLDARARTAWSWGREAELVVVEGFEHLVSALGRALDDRADAIVVQGDDRFLGRVVTAYRSRFLGHINPLRLYALPLGGMVPAAIGAKLDMKKSVKHLIKGLNKGRLTHVTLPCLKVTNSTRAVADYGFSFGAGTICELVTARKAGARGAVKVSGMIANALRQDESARSRASARMTLDRAPTASSSYVIASTLPSTWFDINMSAGGGGARVRCGEHDAELVRALARSRAPLSRLRGEAAPFSRMTFDRLERYLLDGELVEAGGDAIVRVAASAPVQLLR